VADLNLDLIAAPDRTLTVGGRGYPIRGAVSVPTMLTMLQLEQDLSHAYESEDRAALAAAMRSALELVTGLIREKSPDAPGLDDLEPQQLAALLGWLAGADTVTGAVTDALAGDGADTDTAGDDEQGAGAGEGSGDPLASGSSSSSPSSSSATPAAGGQATGSPPVAPPTGSPGGSSSPTSKPPAETPAAAA